MTPTIIGFEKYKNANASSLCLGTFDGFHKGHQKLAENAEFMLTFNPHPKNIVSPDTPIERLTFPDEQAFFYPNLLVIEFSKTIAKMSTTEFLTHFIEPLRPSKLTIGYDFRFGKHGKGNAQTLTEWGNNNNCEIIEIDIQRHTDNTPYKSSIIRKKLKEDPNYAIELLGHPYLISGTVISGEKKGRHIGFPTANIDPPSTKCLPKFGVYKSTAIVNGTRHNAITYIGKKPTFANQAPSVETHILNNFSDDIYNKSIIVLLEKFLREDIQFTNEDDLIQQIKSDISTSIQ